MCIHRVALNLESNYAIAIASLIDWLKNLAPSFNH